MEQVYYGEYPKYTFTAPNDNIAVKISPCLVIYKESDTKDGMPFIIIKDDRTNLQSVK